MINDAGYAQIIDHPEYNPRLIEYITGLGSLGLGDRENHDFLGFAVGVLDDPERIWRQAFENQLEPAERGLLVVLASMQTEVTAADLETGFRAFCAAAGIALQGTLFHRSLRVLEGSFAEVHPESGESLIVPSNPSIVDFVSAWLVQAPAEALALCDGAAFFAQLEWLARSVLRNLETGTIRREQLVSLAAGIRRLFEGSDPRWKMMHIGSVHSPAVLTPADNAPCARLIFLVGLVDETPELEDQLGEWLEERIAQESASWEERHIPNAAEPVGLVRARRGASRPTRVVAERAKQHLLTRLRSVYAWEQLIALREIEPDIFPLAEWDDLRNRFEGFAEDFTDAHDDIDEVEEVDSLISLGKTLGVDLEPMEIEFVRDEVRRRIGQIEDHLEAQQGDREPRLPDHHEENREIAALFGRLAEDRRA